MVYYSDFYTTRRPYHTPSPSVTSYSVTDYQYSNSYESSSSYSSTKSRREAPWDKVPTVPRPSQVPLPYTIFGKHRGTTWSQTQRGRAGPNSNTRTRTVRPPKVANLILVPQFHLDPILAVANASTDRRVVLPAATTTLPSVQAVRPGMALVLTTRRTLLRPPVDYLANPRLIPAVGKAHTYHPSIPRIAHKKMTNVTTPVPHNEVRKTVIYNTIDRIHHKPRSLQSYDPMEDFLNERSVTSFEDVSRSIRANTAALLKKVHTPIPRAIRPLSVSNEYNHIETPISERISSDEYIWHLLRPLPGRQHNGIDVGYYPETSTHVPLGKTHLSCLSYAGNHPISKRRHHLVLGADDDYRNVRNDVELLSYYNRMRKAASVPRDGKLNAGTSNGDVGSFKSYTAHTPYTTEKVLTNGAVNHREEDEEEHISTPSKKSVLKKKPSVDEEKLAKEAEREAEQRRQEEEEKRKAERRAEEEERKAEARRKAEEERYAEQERLRAEHEEEERKAEARRKAEEERYAEQERLRKLHEEEERKAEARRKAEEERYAEQERLRAEHEEEERKAEARRKAEEERYAEQERLRVQHEEEERKAEARRKAEEERYAEQERLKAEEKEKLEAEEEEAEFERLAADRQSEEQRLLEEKLIEEYHREQERIAAEEREREQKYAEEQQRVTQERLAEDQKLLHDKLLKIQQEQQQEENNDKVDEEENSWVPQEYSRCNNIPKQVACESVEIESEDEIAIAENLKKEDGSQIIEERYEKKVTIKKSISVKKNVEDSEDDANSEISENDDAGVEFEELLEDDADKGKGLKHDDTGADFEELLQNDDTVKTKSKCQSESEEEEEEEEESEEE